MTSTATISIHALREEGDLQVIRLLRCHVQFLSTPSVRRATRADTGRSRIDVISIHALREEGDHIVFAFILSCLDISIHALREEGDLHQWRQCTGSCRFLSTPSVRRATTADLAVILHTGISIHALREEGDTRQSIIFCGSLTFLSTPSVRRATCIYLPAHPPHRYFYPRPP